MNYLAKFQLEWHRKLFVLNKTYQNRKFEIGFNDPTVSTF